MMYNIFLRQDIDRMAQSKVHESLRYNITSEPPGKQNYVPFISKSPRFGIIRSEKTDSNQKFPRFIAADVIKQQLPDSMRRQVSSVNNNNSIFKSNVDRFQEEIKPTPSPGQYSLFPNSLSKTKPMTSPHKGQSVLPQIKTIPTIPDHRNKYGYLKDDSGVRIVQKTQQQLQKEKNIMHQYQRELVNENRHERKEYTEGSRTPRMSELNRQVREHLRQVQNEHQIREIRKKSTYTRSCLNTRQMKGHLYSYDATKSIKKQFPVLERSAANSTREAKQMKFQFFNSSQKRFKTEKKEGPQQRQGVREYLQKMIKSKQVN